MVWAALEKLTVPLLWLKVPVLAKLPEIVLVADTALNVPELVTVLDDQFPVPVKTAPVLTVIGPFVLTLATDKVQPEASIKAEVLLVLATLTELTFEAVLKLPEQLKVDCCDMSPSKVRFLPAPVNVPPDSVKFWDMVVVAEDGVNPPPL